MLGDPLGPKGKRRRFVLALQKELVETTQGLRGRGVAKVSNVVLGYETVQQGGGHVKRGLSIADLTPPNKIARTGGVGMACSLEGNDKFQTQGKMRWF